MPQRILSVSFTNLPNDRLSRIRWGTSWCSNAPSDAQPIILVGKFKNVQHITALDEKAKSLGLFQGQSLAEARAIAPNIESIEEDPEADNAMLDRIAAWCDRYTPLVALDRPDGLFLDITGCSHLFGGEEKLIDDLLLRLKHQGFSTQACIADTPGAAWAMARYGTSRRIAPGQNLSSLMPLPLSALRIAPQTVHDLKRMGLRTVGCIADLPRAPLTARFGPNLLHRLDQACGQEQEIISPNRPVAALSAERRFMDPIVLMNDIVQSVRQLSGHLQTSLEKRDAGARRLQVKLYGVDGEVLCLSVVTSSPVRDPARITALFQQRLAMLDGDLRHEFGFDLIRLDILAFDRFDNRQGELIGHSPAEDDINQLVDRLGARFGTHRVRQFCDAGSHIPELQFTSRPVIQQRSETSHQREQDRLRAAGSELPLIRPAIFFKQPEPIDAIAEVPDGPPVRFRWRKVQFQIARSEGPERIACEWWHEGRNGLSRDYFRVEDRSGYRFWLFREGLFFRECNVPRWFMHGLFP